MKRITLNLSMFAEQYTGMGVYSMHIRDILKKNYSIYEILANRKLPDIQKDKTIWVPLSITDGYSKLASLRRLYYLWNLSYKYDLGLVYTPTHHGIPFYDNQLITVHDLISLHFPEQHRLQYWYFKYILPKIIKRCKGIVAVSNTTKEEICKYYHVSHEFVYVLPNALDNVSFFTGDTTDYNYLLCVGAGYPHKNIHELLNVYHLWSDKYKLKIVSARGAYKEYLEKIVKERKLADKVSIEGFVAESRLEELYRHCSALVYPSKWEGFGIPPLEAMRYCKPIILSDIEIFKEVYANNAIYVTLENEDSWRHAFERLKTNNIDTDAMKSKYIENLKKYSWEANEKVLIEIMSEMT